MRGLLEYVGPCKYVPTDAGREALREYEAERGEQLMNPQRLQTHESCDCQPQELATAHARIALLEREIDHLSVTARELTEERNEALAQLASTVAEITALLADRKRENYIYGGRHG
jgi:hypothetical protein